MPANNRVHSSAALQTHGIWQSAIGYDPYAPNKDDSKKSTQENSSAAEPEGENAYASFQGLLALARITSSNVDEARGACKRCGRVGHLAFQCRNFVSVKDGDKEKDSEAVQAAVLSGLEKIKGNGKRAIQGEESDEDESETSDSEVDSEIERIIAERYGKKKSGIGKSSRKKEDSDDDGSDSGRKKRGRSKKRRSKKRGSSDSEDEDEDKDRRKKRKEKRRKKNESSGEEDDRQRRKRKSRKEKRRRRSHRHSDDSDSDEHEHSGRRHKQKSTKASSLSDPDASGSDDPRVGRDTKRSEKKIRKRHHEDDE